MHHQVTPVPKSIGSRDTGGDAVRWSHGRECSGYGLKKPVVWTGVACRRKAKGRKSNGSCVHPTTTEPPPGTDVGCQNPHLTAALSATPTDPVFQDLNISTRRNVEYYLRECCSECTIYGDDFGNPFKQMLVLMPHNTAVRDIIVAISVYHQARAGSACLPAAIPQPSTSSPGKVEFESNYVDYSTVMTHAYKATCSLRAALSQEDCSDAVVASSFLFTWLDMLDTDVPSWQHHLAGMKSLMRLQENKDTSASTVGSLFHGFFREAFAIAKIDPARELPQLELNAVLQRAQSWSWVGCPAELIGVLHALNGLQSQTEEPSPEDVESALTILRNFSCSGWALDFPGKDLHKQRLDMASAYKGAIMIYASRALGTYSKDISFAADIVDQTLHHLQQISPTDSHFKGILWPAFVIGAEARLPEQRLWVANALEQLYGMIHMWNIKRGLSVLQRLWERPLSSHDSTSWLEEVYKMDEKLMLI